MGVDKQRLNRITDIAIGIILGGIPLYLIISFFLHPIVTRYQIERAAHNAIERMWYNKYE